MTALTEATARSGKEGELLSFKVSANTKIFRGALLKINSGGFVAPAAAEAGALFIGVSRESVDTTGLTNGEMSVLVDLRSAFYAAASGIAVSDLGKKAYASDDNTVQASAGTNLQKVGKIIEIISATRVLVLPDFLQEK